MNYFGFQYAAKLERCEQKGYFPYIFQWSDLTHYNLQMDIEEHEHTNVLIRIDL